MKTFISSLRILTVSLFVFAAFTTVAFAQQWSSYDTSGNLVTANVASGGAIDSGSVTFTIPANTQLSFVTKNFVPINLATATSKKTVTFNVSASGAFGGVTQRTMGWGLYNSAGTSGFSDDAGFFGFWNGAGPYLETYDHTAGSANLFTGTHLGQGTVNSGTPSNGVTYTNQIQLCMNSSGTAISLGTSSSTLAAAGLGMNGVGVTERAYTNPDGAISANSFDEFVFMFNNTTASPVTVTLSQLSLVATVTWDASGTSPLAPTDGSGTWSVTNVNWSNGSVDNGWTDGQNAIFGNGGAPGTITIPTGVSIAVGDITFKTNYNIAGGNQLFLTNNSTVSVSDGASATNTSILAGGGFTKTGTGRLVLNPSSANLNSGPLVINGGIVLFAATTVNNVGGDVVINSGGALNVAAGSSLPTQNTLFLNGGASTNVNSGNSTETHSRIIFDNGGIIACAGTSIGQLNVTNMDMRNGTDAFPKFPAAQITNCTVKSTAGTGVVQSRANNSGVQGMVLTVLAGTMIADYPNPAPNNDTTGGAKFMNTGTLTLGGGTLFCRFNAIANRTESVGRTTVIPGATSVQLTNNSSGNNSYTFAQIAITRNAGGTVDYSSGGTSTGTKAITTTTANVNGILGGWATYGGTDWAIGTTLAPLGTGSYSGDSDATTWLATTNVSLNGNPLANLDDTTINSLRITAASTVTINSGKTLTLSSGGLLATGSSAMTITGGNLAGGAAGGDLIVHQYSSGNLTIASDLADNSGSSLTKSGPGKLILTGVNNLTGTNYLNGGTVEVSDLGKLASGPLVMNNGALRYTGSDVSSSRAITVNGLGAILDVAGSAKLTQTGAIVSGGGVTSPINGVNMGDWGGLTKAGSGTLVLAANNIYNGPTVISNGVLSVNGTNSLTGTSGLVNYLGGGQFTVYATLGGNGLISGPVTVKNGGTIAPGNSIGTLTLATNLNLESGSTSLFDVTNGAAGDLLAVQGNLTIQTNCTLAINILGSALEPTTNVLITYTGTKSGSFNPTVVIIGGSLNGSVSIDESTAGQIKLVVIPQVAITSQPADLTVSTNTPATFNVTATGTAPLNYQWYRYSDINGSSPVAQTDETNSSFTIASVQTADSGYYGVVVANSYNSVTSRVATLIVGNIIPTLSGPADTTVIAGNNATFSTTVVLANPAPALQWQTNGVDVAGATGTSLTLNSVPFSYDGMDVSVIATNLAGSTTNHATLTVITVPVISPQPTNLTVNVGDTANFVSGASGVPTPTLRWYKNGVLISGANSGTLSIANTQGSDIANYWLVASNSAGSVTSAVVKLTVLSTNLSAVSLSPTNGGTGICYDTPLYITFNGPISIVNSGKIRIYNVNNSTTPVDTIDMSSNNIVVSSGINLTNNIQAHSLFPGDSQVINYFPVIITGNTAAVYPHGGVMTNNQTYYVTIEPGVVRDSSGAYFAGISDTNTWQFTTKSTGPANATNIVVAADGSGDFVTVQGAVDSVPSGNNNYTVINIRNGNYVEIVDISGKNNITFRGQSRTGVVVGYANNNNLTGTTAARMAFKVNSADIKLENLTITNGTPQGGSQAEALLVYNNGLRCVIENCDIYSRQDTLLINAAASQAYFDNCKVIGNFDYIWGSGVAYFNNCLFHTLTNTLSGSYNLTAARTATSGSLSGTTPWVNPNGTTFSAYGFTFVGCTFEADNGVSGITLAGSNGTAGGLDAWIFCKFSPAYVAPSSSLSNSYVFWQNSNTDTNGNPITFLQVQVIGVTNNDARMLAATNVTTWFSSWTPALAPNIIGQPSNVTVTAGQTATFNVNATGLPGVAYQWLQNGTNAPYTSANNATLAITNAQAADAATYSVVVSNGSGAATSSSVTLTVITPAQPTFDTDIQMTGGAVQFSFSGTQGADYRVWATTNIALTPIIDTWTLVGSGTFGASPVPFSDNQATNYPQRFYIITSP